MKIKLFIIFCFFGFFSIAQKSDTIVHQLENDFIQLEISQYDTLGNLWRKRYLKGKNNSSFSKVYTFQSDQKYTHTIDSIIYYSTLRGTQYTRIYIPKKKPKSDTIIHVMDGLKQLEISYYHENNELNKKVFRNEYLDVQDSNHEAFMSGRHPSSRGRGFRTDTTVYYNQFQKIKSKSISIPNQPNVYYDYNYDENNNLEYVIKEVGKKLTCLIWSNQDLELPDQPIKYIAKINETKAYSFPIKNIGKRNVFLKIKNFDPHLKMENQLYELRQGDSIEINFTYSYHTKEQRVPIILENEKQERFVPLLEFVGYDLDQNNFKSSRIKDEKLKIYEFINREEIILKLEGTEKLLEIVKDGIVIAKQPIGQLLDVIDIRPLESGLYYFRIVDLNKNVKQLCKLKIVDNSF